MKATHRTSPVSEGEITHYVSFILRCQVSVDGRICARLIEVHSGVSYAMKDLEILPSLVRRLVHEASSTR